MFELLKHRKRRRRLSILFSEEEMMESELELESPLQRPRSSKRIRNPHFEFDASSDFEHAETESETVPSRMPRTKRRAMINHHHPLWSLLLATTAVAALLYRPILDTPTANAFQSTSRQQQQQQQQQQSRRSSLVFPLSMSLATPPIPSKTELESMKVVDLKQLIKDSGLNERGLLSKLKKKQDLVEFLTEQEQEQEQQAPAMEIGVVSSPPSQKVVIQQTSTSPTTPSLSLSPSSPTSPKLQQQQQQQQQQPRKMPLTMPKKKPTTATPADANSDQQQQTKQSPMTELFERIHDQYPALQFLQDGNRTLMGELDIRQRYHPMLQAGNQVALTEEEEGYGEEHENADTSNHDDGSFLAAAADGDRKKGFKPALSGDMDLIFVGTASCTPSITRGVSCTALRLHSLASSASSSNKKKQMQQYNNNNNNNNKGGNRQEQQTQRFDIAQNSQSNLGTWLFDCGESTQVRNATQK
jgi:hypothetical protein